MTVPERVGSPAQLNTVSLRLRVTAAVIIVLAVMLLLLGVVVNAIFLVQSNRSLDALLDSRVQLARQLARAGMGALTRTLAMEWGRYGIGLVCVAPGWIDTEGVRGYGLDLDEVAATIPMQRLGGADEVGDLIAYLASPAAAYITGQTIAIDGGVDLTSSGWELPRPR